MNLENYEKYLKDNNKAKTTIEAYVYDTKGFIKYCRNNQIQPLTVDANIMDNYLQYLKTNNITNKTMARKLISIRNYYTYLFKMGIMRHIPTFNSIKSTHSKNITYISRKDYNKMIRSIDINDFLGTRNKTVIMMLYETGLKTSELLNITLDNIDLNDNCIYYKEPMRRLSISGDLKSAISRYLRFRQDIQTLCDNLFINHRGRKLSRQSIFRIVKDASNDLHITYKIDNNSFRDTYILNHFIQGKKPFKLFYLLNYTDAKHLSLFHDYYENNHELLNKLNQA